jgi:hypothetical protein
MSGFVSSIVRGAGFTIGRNLVGDFGKMPRSFSNSSRFYDRAENGVEKGLNFPIQGKSDTILGKCFNLYQELENRLKDPFIGGSLLFSSQSIRYYKETIEKLEDTIEYLVLKDTNDPNIDKMETIMEKVTESFSDYINRIVPTLLNEKRGYVKEKWVTLKPIYLQTNPNSEITAKIDFHIQPLLTRLLSKFK